MTENLHAAISPEGQTRYVVTLDWNSLSKAPRLGQALHKSKAVPWFVDTAEMPNIPQLDTPTACFNSSRELLYRFNTKNGEGCSFAPSEISDCESEMGIVKCFLLIIWILHGLPVKFLMEHISQCKTNIPENKSLASSKQQTYQLSLKKSSIFPQISSF